MPSVTISQKNLREKGPVVEVLFHISEELEKKLKEESKEIPKPVSVKALIDTGASSCIIQEDIPKKLGIKPIGQANICTPSTDSHSCYQYFLRMAIPTHNLTYQGVFISVPLKGQEIDCLIGRDILADSIFIYIGNNNQFSWSLL